MNSNTEEWFELAKPNPTRNDAAVQVGCHMEEFAEMLEVLGDAKHAALIHELANSYKTFGEAMLPQYIDRVSLADALADQHVTATGAMYMLGIDPVKAVQIAMTANWSKFENGVPVFDENGKIKKGRDYKAPDFAPAVGW